MKQLIVIFLILCVIPICKGAWYNDKTSYRLEVTPRTDDQVFFVDLHNKIFPASFKNGAIVFTDKGNPADYFFSKDKTKLFIQSIPNNSLYHIYFGFDKKQPSEQWKNNSKRILQENKLEIELKKVKIIKKKAYTKNDQVFSKLCSDIFEPAPHIKKLQNQVMKITRLKKQIQKLITQAEKLKNKNDKIKNQEKHKALKIKLDKINLQFTQSTKKLSKKERESENYKQIWSTLISKKKTKEILLEKKTVKKIKKTEIAALRFKGNLFVEDSGEYQFAVNSTEYTLMTIDGQIPKVEIKKHSASQKWDKIYTLKLKSGLHAFCFYYVTEAINLFCKVAWKTLEETEFHTLKNTDFAPAYPSVTTNCTNKSHQSFPIINYELNGLFLLQNEKKAKWINTWIKQKANSSDYIWLSDETPVSKSNACSFLQIIDADNNLFLSSKSALFDDISIQISETTTKLPLYDPDIYLKLWTPAFIYDTEILDMDYEMVSGLTKESNVLLKTTVSRPADFFKNEIRFITLEGRQHFKNSRFSPPSRVKKTVEIMGSELHNGLEIALYLMIPPVIFSQYNICFKPINQCTDLTQTINGLTNNLGKRVIPILHRPNLSEKRTWSLPKNIINGLSSVKKLMIIADDFGQMKHSFKNSLQKRCDNNKIKLEFISWKLSEFGSTLKGNIGRLIPVIQKTDADRILIIPPAEDINTGISVRIQTRALAAFVQIAQSNNNIRIIYASSPFPSLQKTKLDDELSKSLQEMTKEYNIEFLDMNAYIHNKPDWRDNYRFEKNNDTLYEPYPVHSTEEISQKIIDSL